MNKVKTLKRLILLGIFMILFYLCHDVYTYFFIMDGMCGLSDGVFDIDPDTFELVCRNSDYVIQPYSEFIFKPY